MMRQLPWSADVAATVAELRAFAPPPAAWGSARRTPSPLRRGGVSDGGSEAERREFQRRAAALGLQLPM